MKNIKRQLQLAVLGIITVFSFSIATPFPSTVSAACEQKILTFPSWNTGLKMDSKCNITSFKLDHIWVIVMNIIEVLLQLVAYVSAGFIIWGGFKYIKSEGDPGKISEAKSAILNAIIGLVIALASVAIVQFIQGRII